MILLQAAGCPQCGGGRNVLTVLVPVVGRGTSGRPKHQKTLARSQCRLGHLARARTQHFSLSLGWITTTIYSLPAQYSLFTNNEQYGLYICQCKIEEVKESASEDYSLHCIELLTLLIWNVRLMFNKFNSSSSFSPQLGFILILLLHSIIGKHAIGKCR